MFERETLRGRVRDLLREWIIEGELQPGERIAEPDMAGRLGVSRTPVREALLHLEREGFVASEVGKGFRVVSVSIEMIHETYPIIGALERLALHQAGLPATEACRALRRINADLRDADRDTNRQCVLDKDWHVRLLEGCPNRRLLELITSHTQLIRRFDFGSRRGVADLEVSCRQHDEVLDDMEAGELEAAGIHLERHWVSCIEPVEAWLRANALES